MNAKRSNAEGKILKKYANYQTHLIILLWSEAKIMVMNSHLIQLSQTVMDKYKDIIR